jgi:hypothetical protein
MVDDKNPSLAINQHVSAERGPAIAVSGNNNYIASKTSNWHVPIMISITCLVLIGAGMVLTVWPSGKMRIEAEPPSEVFSVIQE